MQSHGRGGVIGTTAHGPYDDGYKSCPCFWGTEPGTFVKKLVGHIQDMSGMLVLDAGCGEGKNAKYLSSAGAIVRAIDVSPYAIANAKKLSCPSDPHWELADIREIDLPSG